MDQLDQTSQNYSLTAAGQRNKVLRNTMWLLALSLLPTIAGAWVGMATGITAGLRGFVGFAVFIVGLLAFQAAIFKFRNSSTGVFILMAFTFFMGLMLSRLLGYVMGMSNGTTLVMNAFASTAGVFAVMATLATVIKRDLSGMGKWLFAGMIAIVIAAAINLFFGSSLMMLALTALSTILFSFYMLYDLKNIIDGGETNYIVAATHLYIDIFAVFQNLLAIFGIFGGDD
ncbi:Bax inhibitor-1 family protein [Hydrogenophaga sp. 5NK40-0174]|uniref:Bax inhibitor-1 family protein n=1 Tax=Hydrogenophaga sp. 5NK40-0174 TaxID=3127649 RepID=UPI00310916DF